MNFSELDALYGKYGFDLIPIDTVGVRAYAYQSGYFLNADLVPISDKGDVEAAKLELENSGYACTVRRYLSIEDAENHLFSGFFAADNSRKRLRQDYQRFAKAVSGILGAPYSYVSTRYVSDGAEDQNEDIIEHILRLMSGPGSVLVILEAAAGFGKTCTAYEILNRLLGSSRDQIPILTELSLNRQAKIFRYVLLDEIDRNFPGLNSELVQDQIRRGKTPLILDGFDELLSRGSGLEDDFEDAEPMLETISQILADNAKVLLTTRRTAIFSEQDFDKWIASKPAEFNVYRIRLDSPTIEDWLGRDRLRLLEQYRVPIADLANPVLLAFLKHVDDTNFLELCKQPEKLVDRYFESLLEREVTRQNLSMNVQDQLKVFRSLASNMLWEGFTTDAREYIQLRIIDEHTQLLERTRSYYSLQERPTIEELAVKLSNHALLDRRGGGDQQVGFINDFVLGTFTGNIIAQQEQAEVDRAELLKCRDVEFFVDVASTAYVAQGVLEREQLWGCLCPILEVFNPTHRVRIELRLKRSIQSAIVDASIEGVEFYNCTVGGFYVSKSSFIDCAFRNVRFDAQGLDQIAFLNCTFYDCKVTGEASGPVRLLACRGDGDSIEQLESLAVGIAADNPTDEIQPFMRAVLENFWPKGRAHASNTRAVRALYRGHSKSAYAKVSEAIERLKKQGLITLSGEQAYLNADKLDEFYVMIERGNDA